DERRRCEWSLQPLRVDFGMVHQAILLAAGVDGWSCCGSYWLVSFCRGAAGFRDRYVLDKRFPRPIDSCFARRCRDESQARKRRKGLEPRITRMTRKIRVIRVIRGSRPSPRFSHSVDLDIPASKRAALCGFTEMEMLNVSAVPGSPLSVTATVKVHGT